MNFLSILLELQNQLRIYHWQTESFATHKALGDAYENLDEHIDTFVEEFMGKYGKIRSDKGFNINLKNIDQSDINNVINTAIEFLSKQLPSILQTDDTNLFNIRDEMLGTLEKLKYLLTLK
jgi:DNA-binding ferritin-like protein